MEDNGLQLGCASSDEHDHAHEALFSYYLKCSTGSDVIQQASSTQSDGTLSHSWSQPGAI